LRSMGTTAVREMLSSVLESLYRDRIKPMASYVKGRLKEKQAPEPIIKGFVNVYLQHADLFEVQRPTKDDTVILFCKDPSWFQGWVDMDSLEDTYDESMWEDLERFLDGQHAFAGGRYGTARELIQRNLPFLAPFSLGEVCHIIQLAIQKRKLIVYHRKMLKPIQSIMAQQEEDNRNSKNGNTPDSEIKDASQLCFLLLRAFVRNPSRIPLSRLKTMLKNDFGSTLIETSFMCTKLRELFTLPPLDTTFTVSSEDNGKAIFIDLGDVASFTDDVRTMHAEAREAEATRGRSP